MSKRTAIHIVSYLTAAIFTVFGFLIVQYNKTAYYKTVIERTYEQAIIGLGESVDNIDTQLEKTLYVTSSAQINSLSAALLKESETAKNDLSKLPKGEEELTTVNLFLSQVGNYAYCLSQNVSNGISLTENDNANLMALSKNAKIINEALKGITLEFNNEEHWLKEINSMIEGKLEAKGLAEVIYSVEEELTDYPTLIYDGPFSEHQTADKIYMTENKSEIKLDDAFKIAATAMNVSAGEITYSGECNGKIPSFSFQGNEMSAEITKKGGYVLYFRKYRPISEIGITEKTAVEKAKKYLASRNIPGMTDTFSFTDEGVCVINFAYRQNSTICYPDLIKVGVAMDNGEIVLYETAGYLTNHRERDIPESVHTEEEAMSVLSDNLSVISVADAVIPDENGGEKFCREFTCKGIDGADVIVYIDKENLHEDRIFIVFSTSGGTLTK